MLSPTGRPFPLTDRATAIGLASGEKPRASRVRRTPNPYTPGRPEPTMRNRLTVPAIITVLLVFAGSIGAYQFYNESGIAVTSDQAARWVPNDLPLQFRLLENERLPAEHLGAAEWRELVTRAVAHWTKIPTSTIVVVLDEEPLVADLADIGDGLNTIGFTGDEYWEDSRSIANAYALREGRRIAGCDIRVNPWIFDRFDRRTMDNPQKKMERLGLLEMVVAHEVGHCLGLAHSDLNSTWEARAGTPAANREGFYPEGTAALHADPIMSYGGWHDLLGLTPDDITGISLLYPTREFTESTGAIGGRLVFAHGRGVSHAYVQAVLTSPATGPHLGPGAFTDAQGQFLVEGLPPGHHLFWAHPIGDLLSQLNSSKWEMPDLLAALEARDRWFWAEVRARRMDILPPLTVPTGRTPS